MVVFRNFSLLPFFFLILTPNIVIPQFKKSFSIEFTQLQNGGTMHFAKLYLQSFFKGRVSPWIPSGLELAIQTRLIWNLVSHLSLASGMLLLKACANMSAVFFKVFSLFKRKRQ